jgi:hypothetical protein
MPYLDRSDGAPERAGKIAGDIFAALIMLAVVVIFVQSMMTR